jgi:hypothetical protein
VKKRPVRLSHGNHLDHTSPWIRCIIGPIVARERRNRPPRRGSFGREIVLIHVRRWTIPEQELRPSETEPTRNL